MNSRKWLNLGLAIVVLGLAGLIWYLQMPSPKPESERLTPLSKADIQRIDIRPARHAGARLERRDGVWWLVEPLTARADMARVDAAIGLARATSLARYAASAVDAEQAGLATPDLVLRINDITLNFGGTDALKGRRFVRVGDEVHLITDRYSYLLQGGLASLVSPALLAPRARLREIRLPGLHLQLQNERWQLASGEARSSDALQALVDNWKHASALKVSRSDGAVENASGDSISLQLVGESEPVRFVLQQGDGEILLIREDLGLAYHFTPSAAARLLSLSAPADENGGA